MVKEECKEVSDVNLSRSGSFDTGYGDLDDATSNEGRMVVCCVVIRRGKLIN